MKVHDFLENYQNDPLAQTFFTYCQAKNPQVLHLKGCVGSLDAVWIAAMVQWEKSQGIVSQHIIVLHDREEAGYFNNDLQNLLDKDFQVLHFPISYKRPYEYEEIENANVLMRTETLEKISQKNQPFLVVTYPEAFSEKVVNRKSLIENTLILRKGDKIDINQLSAQLVEEYNFERTDFVYEPGQFALRGGIIDLFSFANDLPYRLDLLGDEIENIRLFDPQNQLSVENVELLTLLPNLQTKFVHAVRESFLEFIPTSARLWFKDMEAASEAIERSFLKVETAFEEILTQSNFTQVISNPEVLFETKTHFEAQLPKFVCIEFGKKYHQKAVQTIQLTAKPQPSFNKDFSLLVKNLQEFQQQGFQHFIAAESYKQIDRLRTIFEELDPQLRFQALPVALREGFIDLETKTLCYTDHQIFERFHRYRTAERFAKSKALTLRELRTLQPGDYVTHIDYGIGRFAGLEKTEVNGKQQEVIRLVYRDNDLLFVNIHALHKIAKYAGKESTPPSISKLGSGEWENKKRKVKRQVQDIAKNLISLYAKRRSAAGCAFSPDSFLQAELESSFLYEDTPDQAKATQHVKEDMEKPYPMDRLVCGDVGFGKTEVAIRAAFKAICDNKQVAVLVPTTILALQHYKTFRERLEKFPCKIEYINRFRNSTQIKETLKNIETGETQILIGTHRIVNKDVKFKDLGLLIIDEEQKFGVKVKDKIKEMRVNVDVLTLTATPIPRTLQFSMMGARDLSIIATPPTNRQPVTTELHTFNEAVIRDAITYEIRRGGQVFFVHNRVNDIDSIANMILKLVPDARIGVAHGQMEGSRLEKVMLKFIEGEYDLLISTNIIESGLDIPNANTIIINMAHMFGLSDLHQMRGRVGRSNKKAFCYLLTPASSLLSTDARKRLQALEEFSDLGDGFKIAMRDLDIRGAGNLLGAEQSGFINDLGFETYHKILDEAVQELKDTEFKELFLPSSLSLDQQQYLTDCNVETDLQILIPDSYVQNISERLSLYSQLDSLKDEAALLKFEKDLQDRFGIIPDEVRDLLQTVRLRWIAEKIGFEKLTLKNQTLKGFFMATKEDYFKGEQFGKVILFLQNQPQKARLKDYNGKPMLILPHLNTIQQAIDILSAML